MAERRLREGIHTLKNEMTAKQFRYLVRVTLQIKDEGIGKIEHRSDEERQARGLKDVEYPNRGNHIAIFECQLKQPPMMCLENHTHLEFLMATRFNFANWRMVDLDNYMGGNPPFT